MTTVISALPTAPSTSSPSTFDSLADPFVAALSTFRSQINTLATELNALAVAMDLNDTTSSSTTSLTIGTGAQSLTVDASKSYQVGMSVKIAHDSTNWMHGEVTSYNAGTGALVVNVTAIFGSGTEASWTITLSGPIVAYVMPVRDATRGLVIKNNATHPTYQMDIDADEIILQDSSGIAKSVSAVNLTVDITASGANGLDTGSEANEMYYIWVANNGTTTIGLLSLSSTAPTLPSGYTFKALVGPAPNRTGDLDVIYQTGNIVTCQSTPILNAAALGSATEVDLSDYVPVTAKKVIYQVAVSKNSATQAGCWLAPASGSCPTYTVSISGASGNLRIITTIAVPITVALSVWCSEYLGGGTITLKINGWEY